ncbi:MAG: hypothetical protein GQ574_21705 [Crocinitomix sp.]|nr:hypothetical protein [Crocinitomix sp.]
MPVRHLNQVIQQKMPTFMDQLYSKSLLWQT